MKLASLITTAAALSLTAAATADFTGLSGTFTDDGSYLVVQLYADFDDATDVTLSVYDANAAGDFNQSDGGGGMWLPFFSSLGGDTSIDSFVNINASNSDPHDHLRHRSTLTRTSVQAWALPSQRTLAGTTARPNGCPGRHERPPRTIRDGHRQRLPHRPHNRLEA